MLDHRLDNSSKEAATKKLAASIPKSAIIESSRASAEVEGKSTAAYNRIEDREVLPEIVIEQQLVKSDDNVNGDDDNNNDDDDATSVSNLLAAASVEGIFLQLL